MRKGGGWKVPHFRSEVGSERDAGNRLNVDFNFFTDLFKLSWRSCSRHEHVDFKIRATGPFCVTVFL